MLYTAEYQVMQDELNAYTAAFGSPPNYPEMSHLVFLKGHAQVGFPDIRKNQLQNLSEDVFLQLIKHRFLPVFEPTMTDTTNVTEETVFPKAFDVYAIQQFYNISREPHSHDYFEIVYVYRGSCEMIFEKNQRTLGEGEVCIIAPNSTHGLHLREESDLTFIIWVRKSTFSNTFFQLLSRNDLLSYFFQTVLYSKNEANFLLFFTENTPEIKYTVQQIIVNSMVMDSYANSFCISLVSILFGTILRNYSQTVHFYKYNFGTDFSLILQYIQHNYLHLSLHDLAEMFHYSDAHLSVLIKKNTGHSFSHLVTQLKMIDAANYLSNSVLKISEIAYMTGYNSPDHFSRAFQRFHGESPTIYRERVQDQPIGT